MLLIYTPEDGDRQEFSFRPGTLLSVEAEAIEDLGGPAWGSYEEFGRKFMAGNRKAYRAALWVLLKRQNPKLRFNDLAGVRVEEVGVDFEDDERARMREAVERSDDMPEEQRKVLLEALDNAEEAETFKDIAATLTPDLEPGTEGKDEAGAESTDST